MTKVCHWLMRYLFALLSSIAQYHSCKLARPSLPWATLQVFVSGMMILKYQTLCERLMTLSSRVKLPPTSGMTSLTAVCVVDILLQEEEQNGLTYVETGQHTAQDACYTSSLTPYCFFLDIPDQGCSNASPPPPRRGSQVET